jgi:hypothetical protein
METADGFVLTDRCFLNSASRDLPSHGDSSSKAIKGQSHGFDGPKQRFMGG